MIVVGGGDTGTDCIGTSVRHGAKQVRPGVSSAWSSARSDYTRVAFAAQSTITWPTCCVSLICWAASVEAALRE